MFNFTLEKFPVNEKLIIDSYPKVF